MLKLQPRSDRSEFEYVLINILNNKKYGVITAVDNGNGQIEIVRYCVALKYRNKKNKSYGRKLLNAIIDEAKQKEISSIKVQPIPFEEFDDVEPMSEELLYSIYMKLGFKSVDGINFKEMIMII